MAINSTGIDACAPEDCSSCTADCSSRVDLKANVIELTTDEGEVIRCQVLLNYEMEGRRYLAVMPLADNPDGDIYLFRVAEGEDWTGEHRGRGGTLPGSARPSGSRWRRHRRSGCSRNSTRFPLDGFVPHSQERELSRKDYISP